MKTLNVTKTHRIYESEIVPIHSTDVRDKAVIEWADKNPVAYRIVTSNRSKAFGMNSCVYYAESRTMPSGIVQIDIIP